MSLPGKVRGCEAPSTRCSDPAALLCVMSHADPYIYGCRLPARPQFPHSASRPIGEARHTECLQRLSSGQVPGMVRSGNRALARTETQGFPELCSGISFGLE